MPLCGRFFFAPSRCTALSRVLDCSTERKTGGTGSFGERNSGLAGDITISGGIIPEGVDTEIDAERKGFRFVDVDGVPL